MTSTPWRVSGIFLIFLSMSGWWIYTWFGDSPATSASPPQPRQKVVAGVSLDDPGFMKMPDPSSRRNNWNGFDPLPSGEKRSDAILRLTASARLGHANDAMAAFSLADECAQGEMTGRQTWPSDVQRDADAQKEIAEWRRAMHAACDNVSPALRAERFANLQIALDAGMVEAMLAFGRNGPGGDFSALETRPNDPDVIAWRQNLMTYLTRAAELGSTQAMSQLSMIYWNGGVVDRDPNKMLMYEVALLDVYTMTDAKPGRIKSLQGMVDRDAAALTADAAEAARQQGHDLAQRCCSAQKTGSLKNSG